MSGKWETTHEFSTNRIVRLFLFMWLFGLVVGASLVTVGVYTDWYTVLVVSLFDLHLAYPWIIGVYAFFMGAVVLDRRITRNKKLKRERLQRKRLERERRVET